VALTAAVVTLGGAVAAWSAGPPAAALGTVNAYLGAPDGGNLDGVSCVSVTECTAVGQSGGVGAYATESTGTWGAVDTLAEASTPEAALNSVSCASATSCSGVGVNGDDVPIFASDFDGTWDVTPVFASAFDAQLNGISCVSATQCTAVGVIGVSDANSRPAYVRETSGGIGDLTQLPVVGEGQLDAVSCTSASVCTAVGNDSSGPIYVRESAGTWGTPTALPFSGTGPELTGITCFAASSCTAVGFELEGSGIDTAVPAYAVESAGTWGPVTTLTPPGGHGTFEGISCVDASHCTAVGRDAGDEPIIAVDVAGTWSTVAEHPVTGGGGLLSVSCSDATDCTAVGASVGNGDQPLVLTETAGTWGSGAELATPLGGSGTFTGLSCTAHGDCTAVGATTIVPQSAITSQPFTQPFFADEVDGTWETAIEIPTAGSLDGISCVSATDCTAVGIGADNEPMVITESTGTWGPPTELSGADEATFDGVSCASATNCTAVGWGASGPVVATESAGTWGNVIEPTVAGSQGVFDAVSCSDATDCTAVGGDSKGAIAETMTAGAWAPVTAIGAGSLSGVSCQSPGSCTAVGTDLTGPDHVTQAAGTWGGTDELSVPSPDEGGDLLSISCPDPADCTAVGFVDYSSIVGSGYELNAYLWSYATESGGAWAPAVVVSSPTDTFEGLDAAVDCTSPTICTAVGSLSSPEEGGGVPADADTAPGPPTIGTATLVSATSASLTFGAPSYDGGSPVAGYTVLESSGRGYSVARTSPSCSPTSCTVTSLARGTTYTFEVEATSPAGPGAPSPPSNAVSTPPTVPGEPRLGTLHVGNRLVTVRWSAPLVTGGTPITSYTASATSGRSTFRCATATTRCAIRGLKNGTTYVVSVVAHNAVGNSKRSATRRVTPKG
jgi:Fibronectin type III domain